MNERQQTSLGMGLSALVIVGLIFGWFHFFEKRTSAVPWESTEAQENPMLAASRLLKQRKFKVEQSANLEQALAPGLAAGNLFISNTDGEINNQQAKTLLNWVHAGNTLIFQPRWSGKQDIVRSSGEGECGQMAVSGSDSAAEDDKDEAGSDAASAAGSASESAASEAASDSVSASDAASASAQTPVSSDDDSLPLNNPPLDRVQDGKQDGKPGKNTAKDNKNADDDEVRQRMEKAMSERAGHVASGKPDPIARQLHVELRRIAYLRKPTGKRKREDDEQDASASAQAMRAAPCISKLRWPGSAYDLRIDNRYGWLKAKPGSETPQISDTDSEAIHVYRQGRGHIVLLAENFFNNSMLPRYDHAELLLHLTNLNPGQKKLIIVQHLSNRLWYEKLWDHFNLGLLAAGLLLALLLWSAMRRFGAVLPLPEGERRALLEHVDASGRWLWHTEKGAQLMLEAMRKLVDKTLNRRLPQLARLSRAEQLEFLVQATSMNRLALELALFKDASTAPQQFIRQITTLQRLRKHYER